jgi:glycerol kinase
MRNFVLSIDQGTTGTFVGLMNQDGIMVRSGYKVHRQINPQPGWIEQDPAELWHNACVLINQVIEQSSIEIGQIAGIGIANQGESILMWDRETGEPVYNVLVWQDTRTQAFVDGLSANEQVSLEVSKSTGLKLDSYFSASKIRWLLDTIAETSALLRADRLMCGTLDTWLIWKMTEGRAFVTDVSTASRTLLFNIRTLAWDPWLLDLFGVPLEILPRVLPSCGEFGVVSHPDLLCRGVSIVASLVDQPAAMIGQGCLMAGQIKATYGTGCFINLNTGSEVIASRHGLLTLLAWQRGDTPTYGLEGGVFTAAASINWLTNDLHLLPAADSLDELCAEAADAGGAVWIPAQVGLGAPYWQRSLRGAWLGLDLTTSRAQLLRAVLEGIAANVAQIVQAMSDDTRLTISSLRVDGGLTASSTMMQIQADLLGFPVEVVSNAEATAGGAASLAARATGLWTDDRPILRLAKTSRTYLPKLTETQRKSQLDRFNEAIDHLKAWQNHA